MKRLGVITGFLLPGMFTFAAKATTNPQSDEPTLITAIVDRNFLVPALVIIVPIAMYRHLKKRSRRRHRLCMKCGYDLSGADHEACPECGTNAGGTINAR